MSEPSARVRAFEAVVRVALDSAEKTYDFGKRIKTADVLEEVRGEEPSARTVRRALNDAQELGWVRKDNADAHIWKPGDRANDIVSAEA